MTTTQGAIRRLELLLARTPDMECADDLRFLLADYTLVIANYKTVCLNNEDLTQKLAEARRLLDDARAQKPLNESIRIVLREALMDGDRYTPQVLVNLDRALSKMRPLYAAPVPPAASTKTHQWEDDHCIKCGDSDWYAGPICSECKVVQPAAVPEAVAKDVIPAGWVFYSADASIQSSDARRLLDEARAQLISARIAEDGSARVTLYGSGLPAGTPLYAAAPVPAQPTAEGDAT